MKKKLTCRRDCPTYDMVRRNPEMNISASELAAHCPKSGPSRRLFLGGLACNSDAVNPFIDSIAPAAVQEQIVELNAIASKRTQDTDDMAAIHLANPGNF